MQSKLGAALVVVCLVTALAWLGEWRARGRLVERVDTLELDVAAAVLRVQSLERRTPDDDVPPIVVDALDAAQKALADHEERISIIERYLLRQQQR